MRPTATRETAIGYLITQRSQVRILSPLLTKRPSEIPPGAVFMEFLAAVSSRAWTKTECK
jgi:hypothetical protein